MPLPGGMAEFNKSVTNKITRPFARHLGGFAVLRHTGRVSGATYETPVNAWRNDRTIVVALTYGDGVDWLKNARAAETSTMVIGGESLSVGRPQPLDAANGRARVPRFVAWILARLDVEGFVEFSILSRPT